MYRIGVRDGTPPEVVTTINEERLELSHRWPHILPGGKHFLFFSVSTYPEINPDNPSEADQSGLYIGSFDGSEPRLLQTARSRVAYRNGSLIYVDDRILMARGFDLDSLSFTGDPVSIASDITQSVDALWGGALFSVSENGTLLFVRGATESRPVTRLTWLDREGNEVGTIGEPRSFNTFRLSGDGKRLAADIGDPADIWIYDLERGSSTRLTFDPGYDGFPVWSPDGRDVMFQSSRIIPGQSFSPGTVFRKSVDGLEDEQQLVSVDVTDPALYTSDWSTDGRHVALMGASQGTGADVLIYSIENEEITTFLQTEDTEMAGRFSPNGRWLAYESDESGSYEVYVRAFPGPGGMWQVSGDGGGSRPVWSADGKELFYVSANNRKKMMSVAVETEGSFRHGTPRELFDFEGWIEELGRNVYDVSRDGDRFLVLMNAEDESGIRPAITLVQGWKPE